ncbi:MAG: hypothetical protein EA349_03975 [Halomonadaceae bacterium]|nr:MAG: hypothetical protein EA349_03975 [Halomonadaceae bacterium]
MIIQVWQLWLVLAIALAALELMGFQFIMLALAVSALVVMVVTLLMAPSFTSQLLLFAVTALVLTPGFIYWFRKHFQGSRSGFGLVGESGHKPRLVMVHARQTGVSVQVDGDWFPVRYGDGTAPVAGETVRILRFEGITAIVTTAMATTGEQE